MTTWPQVQRPKLLRHQATQSKEQYLKLYEIKQETKLNDWYKTSRVIQNNAQEADNSDQ